MDEQGKVIPCSIHVGGSIVLHKHETCKKGSEHSIVNTGDET